MAQGFWLCDIDKQDVSPLDVARVQILAKRRYVVVGPRAASIYSGQPRTTREVDVLAEFPRKASAALQTPFPKLTIQDAPVAILEDFGDLVLPGGGDELIQHVANARAGKMLKI
jgi:hypothetical protein